jgi:hypothetical protein
VIGLQDKLKTIRGVLALLEAARGLRGVTADDLLSRVGMERRRSAPEQALPWLGGFTAGVAVGGAAGLLLAPMEGRKLRARIRNELGKLGDAWIGYDQHADERPGGFDSGEQGVQAGT